METFISSNILMTYDSEDNHQIRLNTIPKTVCWNPALTCKKVQWTLSQYKTGCTYKTGMTDNVIHE